MNSVNQKFSHSISGHNVINGPNNGRIYPPEALKDAIKDYMKKLKQKQRREKLEKINDQNKN